MSEKNPPDSNFMTKLATFIVDKKTLFFLLYIFAVIFCAFSSGWVNVENDVTTYLPEDTETRQGIVAMNDNFTTFATAQIMVSNVTYETADELSQQIADVEGVSMVTFDDTPDHYTNASALFDISFDGVVSDEISAYFAGDKDVLRLLRILRRRLRRKRHPAGGNVRYSDHSGGHHHRRAYPDLPLLRRGPCADDHLRRGGHSEHGHQLPVGHHQLHLQLRGCGIAPSSCATASPTSGRPAPPGTPASPP